MRDGKLPIYEAEDVDALLIGERVVAAGLRRPRVRALDTGRGPGNALIELVLADAERYHVSLLEGDPSHLRRLCRLRLARIAAVCELRDPVAQPEGRDHDGNRHPPAPATPAVLRPLTLHARGGYWPSGVVPPPPADALRCGPPVSGPAGWCCLTATAR